MRNVLSPGDPLRRHRGWLFAAAAYNVIWGSATLLAPNLFFDLAAIPRPNYPAIWQVVGLFVLLYAPAYAAAATAPWAGGLLVAIGFAGKVAGPIGLLAGWAVGSLPWQFLFVTLTNDLLWWPFFAAYFRDARRLAGSWRTAAMSMLPRAG